MTHSFSTLKTIKFIIAFVFITSGIMKLINADLADFFVSLGLPYPLEVMYIVAWAEIGCGILLLLNKYIRQATLALLLIIIAAILLTKIPALHDGLIPALFNARLDIVILALLIVLYRQRGVSH
ncbi:DoxX family protein [Halobacillus seohaensis]|uniref:DoxX family protein n=1 Tax=Halobacillus seohaensis TaxID=447421 RepID=A0ABW2ERI7_9BACI